MRRLLLTLSLLLMAAPSWAAYQPIVQQAEDAAHTSGDLGFAALCVRKDTSSTGIGANGDYVNCAVDANGNLYITGTVTANAGTNLNTSSLLTTTAHDAAFGTAGSADSQVRTVQGIASMTPLLMNPGTAANFGIYVEDAAETAGGNLNMAGTVRRDTAASSAGATGDNATLNTDSTGRLWVNTELPDGLTATGNALDVNIKSNEVGSSLAEFDFDTGGGTVTQSTIGLALAASGGPVPVSSTDPLPVTFSGGITANAGTNLNTSALLTTSAHDAAFGTAGSADAQVRTIQGIASMTPVIVTATNLDVQSGGADLATETTAAAILTSANFAAAFGTAGTADSQVMSVQGIASMTPLQVQSNSANLATQSSLADAVTALQLIDDDQTGATMHHRISAGSTEDEHEVKGSAGRLFSINVTNTNAAARYLRCANQVAASTTPGTTTVWYGMAIPGATTGAGYTATFGPSGAAFSTGLTCWLVTGAAESDVAEVAANEINVNYTYK